MKTIHNYIAEKLKLGKNLNIKFNLDELIDQNITLYDSTSDFEEEDDESVMWDDCVDAIDNISEKYNYFIAFQYESIMKAKETAIKKHENVEPYKISEALREITEYVMSGKDMGYAVRLVGGHMEIDCINSGSRSTYYIYALSSEGYDRVSAYWEGDESEPNIDFLYSDEQQKYIVPIEDY